MESFNLLVALLGGLVVLLGLGSKRLEQTTVPLTLLALLVGVLVGPHVLGWVDLAALGDRATTMERLARLALGIGLVSVALRVPQEYPRRNWRAMAVLIGLGMPLMWGASTLLVWAVLGLPFWLAALIGAVVTPTDPIASSPIVTGLVAERNLPGRVRNAISFESGANDGLSYLFVFLPFLLLTRPGDEALSHWLLHTLLWEVGAATVLGLAIGFAAGRLLQAAEARDAIEEEWRLVYTAAMALLAIGTGRLIASDEVLVVFAAGVAFVQVVSGEDRASEEHGQEAVNRFFSVPFFAVLGTVIPWEGWADLGWQGALLAAAVITLRRPPVLALLRPLLPGLRGWPDALFLGWFGPIAVAAVYYASLMESKLGEPVVWHVVSLLVCASVAVHGVSSVPLTRLYGRVTGEPLRGDGADD